MAARYKSLFYNFIWIAVALLLGVLTAMGSTKVDALALDQQVRCGLEEHTHTEVCYHGEVLLCKQKAHTHSNNCYLVLLEDNDVNWLLQTMSETGDKSLEGVLDSAMGQALVLNDSFAEEEPPLTLTAQDISSLNQTIEDNGIEPAVVLNENLTNSAALTYALPSDSNSSTKAVGDVPSTGTRAINFYIQLDGRITFIYRGTLTSANPEYYSYANTVSAYHSAVTTSLATNNINSTYYFRYNTDGITSTASDFDSNATYRNSTVRFANSNYAQYALLTTRSRSGNQYVYTPVAFYTVTLDYSQADDNRAAEKEYVQSGQASSFTLSQQYLWYNADGEPVSAVPQSITETTTLYARPKTFTAYFADSSGIQVAQPLSGTPVNGKLQIALPDLAGTAWEGFYWIERDSDGTVWYPSDGSAVVDITENTTFTAVPSAYTVTFVDADGNTTEQTVPYRQTVSFGSLPAGWVWKGSDNEIYTPGTDSAPITQDATFVAAEQVLTVNYDVNFPSGAVSQVDTVPTIYGTTASTATDYARGGRPVTLRALTSRTARDEISASNKESLTYYFRGWTVAGTQLLLQPDATWSWSELLNYADSTGSVSLQGVWESGARLNSVSFFVRFDSAAVDTDGNITSQPSENYTPEIFNTHVGGVDASWSDSQIKDAYEIADTTSDNSFGADQEIRALYGEKATGLWLYDFPSDDHVFTYLKSYLANNPGKQLTVEGKPVDPAELDHTHYAIRWYVFKLEGSSWHIDGKLVKKAGSIKVDKAFGGDEAALSGAKEGFYILAENGTRDANGVFTPYDHRDENYKEYVLVLNSTDAGKLASVYPEATFLVFDSEDGNAHNYHWLITNVNLGEYWHIEEHPVDVADYSYYAEYSVYDTDGEYSAIAQYGTLAAVTGKTFALDEDPDQGMLVSFRNYYYPKETILIKKEDGKTGQPIGGAVFELWQNGNRLSFNYNEITHQYERDEDGDGAIDQIVTSNDGFSIISTTGFSYDYGDVVVKEVLPPAGYDPAPDITVGKDENGTVCLKDVLDTPQDQWQQIAEVPNEDVLVVKDHTAEYISVTVDKVWNTNTPADSVEVVLQANGQHAAVLFPGMSDAQVTLNAGNLWSHTWYELPRYANGQMVQWSVKEVVIGGKPTLSDGVTFANWTVTYSPGVGTDTDGDGDPDQLHFTVTNATRRLQMILTKVGTDGAILQGSVFSLEQVVLEDGQWQAVNGGNNTQITDSNGMLTFDNLTADAYYRLAELSATDGYFIGFQPVVLTMDGAGNIRKVLSDGSFAELNDPLVQITRPYNIQVVNLRMEPLPETGSTAPTVYIQTAAYALLAAALFLYIIKRERRRESSF